MTIDKEGYNKKCNSLDEIRINKRSCLENFLVL